MNFFKLYYSFPALYELPYLIPPELIWRHRATEVILSKLLDLDNLRGKILEIGCGSGFLSKKIAKLLPNMQIYAIDLSANMILYASRKNSLENLKFFNLDFFKILKSDLKFTKFDVVVSLNAWPFFQLEPSVELLKIISKRGTTFFAVTYSNTFWSKVHSRTLSFLFGRHIYLHKPQQFLSVLKNFGFDAQYIWIDSIEGSYLVLAERLG